MEDNSYVSLSLEEYNELYDKAKMYDEITEKLTNIIKSSIDEIWEKFKELMTNNDEQSAATEEVVEETDEIKVGDKVKLIKRGLCTAGFKVGDICIVTNIYDYNHYKIKIEKENGLGFVNEDMIEKVNEGEEN